jgi:hypothetical protein
LPEILSDQPTNEDSLGREQYANAFARIIQEAETPLVIGLYGDWGSGKTSLMHMIDARLDGTPFKTVWFDAWQHQHDDNPAVALAHTLVDELELGEEGKKLLAVISLAFGSMLLKATTSLSVDDISKFGERVEAERFQVRDARSRLRNHFESLVSRALAKEERLVLFIDDLDRCSPDTALALLEALKLYLDFANCVFVIGADRLSLEAAVATRYGDRAVGNSRYLDKVVQLPFSIPPIHASAMKEFVDSLVGIELVPTVDMLVAGLGDNPRSVKRFINILLLNHELAKEAHVANYDVAALALLLLIQHHDPERFAAIAAAPELAQQFLEEDQTPVRGALRSVLAISPRLPLNISEYIYLAQVTHSEDLSSEADSDFARPFQPSAAFAAIVGSRPLPRTEITKRLWRYVKEKKLQDPQERRMIVPDDTLRKVLGDKARVSMFEMTKLVNKHLRAVDSESVRRLHPSLVPVAECGNCHVQYQAAEMIVEGANKLRECPHCGHRELWRE